MEIYFAGSIRGGRDDQELYLQIIEHLQKYGTVLTEHIGNKDLSAIGESEKTDEWIFKRDVSWLKEADIIVAEVTSPSLGVGYELGLAESLGKNIICLYRKQSGKRLSAMIAGNKKLIVKEYIDIDSASEVLRNYFIKFDDCSQVSVTSRVQEVASTINGEGVDLVKNISSYIQSMDKKPSNKFSSNRTASEILEDGAWTGCHEAGLLMLALLRAKGITGLFIQALDRESVKLYSESHMSFKGHVFISIQLEGNTIYINSTTGEISSNLPDKFIIGGKGRDSWDIGLRAQEDMKAMFIAKHKEFYND